MKCATRWCIQGGFKPFFKLSLTPMSLICSICGICASTWPFCRMLHSAPQQWTRVSERGDGDRLAHLHDLSRVGSSPHRRLEAYPQLHSEDVLNHWSDAGCKLISAADKAQEEIPLIMLGRAWLKEVRVVGVQGEGQQGTHFCHVWEQSHRDTVVCLSALLLWGFN